MPVDTSALVDLSTVGDGSPVPPPNGRGDLAPTNPYKDWPIAKLETARDITDKAIDKLVYELYDLTEEEIEIVEGK